MIRGAEARSGIAWADGSEESDHTSAISHPVPTTRRPSGCTKPNAIPRGGWIVRNERMPYRLALITKMAIFGLCKHLVWIVFDMDR